MTAISLDTRELLQLIYRELSASIKTVVDLEENSLGLKITSLRLKVGSDSASLKPDELLDDPVINGGGEWGLEIIFGHDDNTGNNSGGAVFDESQEIFTTDTTHEIVGLFDDLHVKHIQGIGSGWEKQLGKFNIETIADLATLDDLKLPKIVHDLNSNKIIEFRTKARLTRYELPLILPSSLDAVSLYTLASYGCEKLFDSFGSTATSLGRCKQLAISFSLLTTALTDKFLKKFNLKLLREKNMDIINRHNSQLK